MGKLKFWMDNARKISLPQSVIPCITAIVLSIGAEGFLWYLALPVILGICAAHLGMNLADDYFDYKKGIPNQEIRSTLSAKGSVRARMEKCHYILSGQATQKDLLKATCAFLGFASLMGVIVLATQWLIHGFWSAVAVAIYAGLGLFFGIQYSSKPLQLGYHGLGELVIGLMFGPLLTLGVHAALTGSMFNAALCLWGIGIGAMVTNIVYVHSLMEQEADSILGKFTFAHLLRSHTAQISAIAALAVLPFICILANVLLFAWSPWLLLTILTAPMSIYLIISTYRFINAIPQEDKPRWWMGPMGDWNAFVEAGMDWFLIRWLLARNIVTFFCLIAIFVHICTIIL